MDHSQHMLNNAHNVHISGQSVTFNNVAGNQNFGHQTVVDEGIRILVSHVAPGALHNSGERFDPPKCHQNTRVAIQADILKWLDDMESRCPALWMRGPAGAGKSAIAQMIAEICYKNGRLSATFFFSRTTNIIGRGDEKRLIATLAHQLSINVPETRPFIGLAIQKNPLLFDLSLEAQMDALIVEPLFLVSEATGTLNEPQLILIDGLDECSAVNLAQERIVDVLLSSLARMQHCLPHKLFITSRPEHNISSAFSKHNLYSLVRQLPLDDSCNPDEDIRTFLLDSFAKIISTHPYFEDKRSTRWPPAQDVQKLIDKSSGQFIYSSVVTNYIQSEDNFNPMERLNVIIGLKDTKDRPYADLDALYTYIFEQVKNTDLVLRILSVERLSVALHLDSSSQANAAMVTTILEISEGETAFSLRPLSSVLSPRGSGIHYFHASLPDFLIDEERSGRFYINSKAICVDLASRCLNIATKDAGSMVLWSYLGAMPYLAQKLVPADRSPIFEAISNSDLIHTVLEVEAAPRAVGSFFEWILSETKQNSLFANPLSKPVTQIQTWLIAQYRALPFSGFDSPSDIDCWVFPTLQSLNVFQLEHCDDLEILLSLFEASEAVTGSAKKIISDSKQLQYCWTLVPHILYWIEDVGLMGKYAMTADRYAGAATHGFRALLKAARPGSKPKSTGLLTFRLCNLTLLEKATPRTDLYFTALNFKPLIPRFVGSLPGVVKPPFSMIEDNVESYLVQTRAVFPVLNDPASAEYFQLETAAMRALDPENAPPAATPAQPDPRTLVDEPKVQPVSETRPEPAPALASTPALTANRRAFSFRAWAKALKPPIKMSPKKRIK